MIGTKKSRRHKPAGLLYYFPIVLSLNCNMALRFYFRPCLLFGNLYLENTVFKIRMNLFLCNIFPNTGRGITFP